MNTRYAAVELTPEGFIRVAVSGKIDGPYVYDLLNKVKRYITLQKQLSKSALVLIDLRRVEGEDSEARVAAKEFLSLDFDRCAIFGAHENLSRTVLYLIKSVGRFKYTAYFNTERLAKKWLVSGHPDITIRSQAGLLAGSATIFIPLLVLLGWVTNNQFLKRLHPHFVAMNPMTAMCFIVLGICLLWLCLGRLARRQRVVIRILAGLVAIAGVLTLVRYFAGFDTHYDEILFRQRLSEPGFITNRMAPNTGLLMTLLGTVTLLSTYMQTKLQRILSQFFIAFSFCALLLAIYGYAFGVRSFFQISSFIAMSVLSAIVFLIIVIGLVAVNGRWYFHNIFSRISRGAMISLMVFGLTSLLTGVAWQQANNRLKQDNQQAVNNTHFETTNRIQQRLEGYQKTLYGFRGLFNASSTVTRLDFHNYYRSLDAANSLSGVNAISFIKRVPLAELPNFIATTKNDTSIQPQGYPDTKLFPDIVKPEYLLSAYVEQPSGPGTSYGTDVSSNKERKAAFDSARDSGDPTVSEPITFNLTNTAETSRGFIYTIPIYKLTEPKTIRERRNSLVGFVNAAFRYDSLFNGLLADQHKQNTYKITLVDVASQELIYTSSTKAIAPDYTKVGNLDIAGRIWEVSVVSNKHSTLFASNQSLPNIILIAGSVLSFLITILVLVIYQGRRSALVLASKITEDLQYERDVSISNARRQEAIFSAIGEGLIVVDAKGIIELVNGTTIRILGYSEDELVGQKLEVIVAAQDDKNNQVPSSRRPINQALVKRKSLLTETSYVTKYGTTIPVAVSVAPIIQDKSLLGAVEVFRDLTKEREIDRAKTEFVSLASHQLRTPLTAIGWYAEMLAAGEAGKTNPEQQVYLAEIQSGNKRMIELVNSLLDVSRIETGTFRIDPEPTDIVTIAQDVVKEIESDIFRRKQELIEDYAKQIPSIMLDQKLIRMVIQNLLSNASKYTPDKGKIVIKIYTTATKLHLEVSDKGFGIPKKQHSLIFKKLFRADNVTKLDTEGTGLGLYIIKSIVDSSGGKIWFKSAENKGTTFYIELPISGMKARSGSKALESS